VNLKAIFPKASNAFLAANKSVLTNIANDIATAEAAVHLGLIHPVKKPRMNQTEQDFKLLLLARFPDSTIRFEAYKLRIADRWEEELKHRAKIHEKLAKIQGLEALLQEWEPLDDGSEEAHAYILHLRERLRAARNQYLVTKP